MNKIALKEKIATRLKSKKIAIRVAVRVNSVVETACLKKKLFKLRNRKNRLKQ